MSIQYSAVLFIKAKDKLYVNQKGNVQYIQNNEYHVTNKKSRYGCKCKKKLATSSSCLGGGGRGGDLVERKAGNEACFHSKPFCSFL